MRFKTFSYLVQLYATLALAVLLVIVYQIIGIQKDISIAETQRHDSVNLAYELIQSSEDLTRMARSYVATGDYAYKLAFEDIVKIRNGTVTRPQNYSPIYWHLNIADLQQPAHNNEFLQGTSFKELVKAAHYTNSEIGFLIKAKQNSDTLVSLEERAFAIMEQLSALQNIEQHMLHKEAIDLLYSTEYMNAKHSIMQPIQNLVDRVNTRFNTQINQQKNKFNNYLEFLWLIIIIAIFINMAIIVFTARNFISPLKKLSQTDPLTGLLNRRRFNELAQIEFERSQRTKRPFSIMTLDIDHFKKINDTYGHDNGDKVIKQLSNTLKENLRDLDIISRWGGEEFMVLLTEADSMMAFTIAERLRATIATLAIPVSTQRSIEFTVSIGLATQSPDTIGLDEIYKQSDKCLYQAKNNGRNRVVCDTATEQQMALHNTFVG